MRSRNPLFRRFSRLNELQVVDMALSELEQSIKQKDKDQLRLIRRVGLAMQQKINKRTTATDACTDIIRRALSSHPATRYDSAADMMIDLHRARARVETEMRERIAARKASMPSKRPFSDRALKPLTVTLCTLIGIGLAVGGGFALHYLYPNGIFLQSVEIPQMVGQNMHDFTPDPDLFSLEISYQFHRDSEAGTVISQAPQAGMTRRVSPGKHPCTIALTVSLGPQQVQVGDYAGMTEHQALAECRRLGLIPTIQKVSDHPAGNVAKSEPAGGEILTEGSSITLYVGTSHRVARVSVPNLIGNSEIAADTMLSSLGLVCSHVSYMASDQPTGTVIAQSILSGTAVNTGTRISLVVSRGNHKNG